MTTFHLTPTLMVGEPAWDGVVIAMHPHDATVLIQAGHSVALPDSDDGWQAARRVLSNLGLDEAKIQERETFSKTGRLS